MNDFCTGGTVGAVPFDVTTRVEELGDYGLGKLGAEKVGIAHDGLSTKSIRLVLLRSGWYIASLVSHI